MRSRPIPARLRAMRPELEGLETRELLSTTELPAGHAIPDRARPHVTPTISQLPTAANQTTSTIPGNGDGDLNPYGVAFVPNGFAGGGVLQPGDLLVSNFNNSKNLQGTGTTIMLVTPGNQVSTFYQGPPGVGLSTALGVLKRGFVIVGTVPSTDGTSATAGQGSLVVLDKNGHFVTSLTSSTLLDGPWDMTIVDSGNKAQVFVSDVLSGTISRFDLRITATGGVQVVRSVQIASGYIHRGDMTAFEIGPTGLVFDSKTKTLFVASTGDNAIYAIRNAGTSRSDHGTGKVVYQDSTHLHGPLGLTRAPDGNLIAAQGDAINPDTNQPSELVEFTIKGQFVGQFSISTSPGGAFGVATAADNHHFAAVNDNTNTVTIWAIA